MKANQIIKIGGRDYRAMTRRLLQAAQLCELLPPGATVGIKPNLVSPTPAWLGATTHPEVVAGIVDYLREHGVSRIVILESSWVGAKTAESFVECGYEALAQELGLELWDLQKDSASARDCAGLEIQVCDKVDELGFLINVPVLKGHCQTKLTCALKNLKGLIPGREKRRFHALGLHRPIAHLAAGVRPDFIVVDHICGDLNCEDGGHPMERNCLMAALDPVLVDAYACRLLGLKTEEVPYIGQAESLGAGSADLSCLQLVTLGEEVREGLAQSESLVELKDAVQEVESCSACYAYLLPALDMLRQEGLLGALLDKVQGKLCIGQGYRGQGGAVGIGQCTRGFDFFVPGCPPTETDIYRALKEYIGAGEDRAR